MAMQHATGAHYAINKTAGLAYRRDGDGTWESIAYREVPADLDYVAHEKIDGRWFHSTRAAVPTASARALDGKTRYAVNKTAKMAFKADAGGGWQPIDPNDVPAAPRLDGHEKIGSNWFSVYADE